MSEIVANGQHLFDRFGARRRIGYLLWFGNNFWFGNNYDQSRTRIPLNDAPPLSQQQEYVDFLRQEGDGVFLKCINLR